MVTLPAAKLGGCVTTVSGSPKSLSEEGGREEGQGRATRAGETWKTWGLLLDSALHSRPRSNLGQEVTGRLRDVTRGYGSLRDTQIRV